MMNGKIWVQSELGKGSKFSFVFMVETVEAAKEFIPDWSKIKAIVIDNDKETQDLFNDVMHMYAATCDIAACGEDALRLKEQTGSYDICFVNIKTPDIDGFELIDLLKEKSKDKKYVLMFSGTASIEIEKGAARAGINEILYKPIFPSNIVDTVNTYLGIEEKEENIQEKPIRNFKGFRILLAEDIEVNREIILALLKPAMLTIDCVKTVWKLFESSKIHPTFMT